MKKRILIILMISVLFISFIPTIKANDVNLVTNQQQFFRVWGAGTYPTQTTYDGYTCYKIERNEELVNDQFLCEYDSLWYGFNAGDHLVFSLYIATESSTANCNNIAYCGARVGLDMYSAGRICEIDALDGSQGWISSTNSPTSHYPQDLGKWVQPTVAWNQGWTFIKFDFIIPQTYNTDINGNFEIDSPIEPTGCIFWVCMENLYPYNFAETEFASAYIRDMTFQINPSEQEPQPTVEPTVTPTPTQTQTPTVQPTQPQQPINDNSSLGLLFGIMATVLIVTTLAGISKKVKL